MTLLALRAVLARVPGIAWVILLVIAVLGLSAYGVYHRGERAGEGKVHARALSDSVVHQRAAVDTAVRKSDTAIAVARKAVRISTAGRVSTRAVLEAEKDAIPADVFSAVIEQLARDSTTIAVQAAATDTQLAERVARIQMDTLEVHQVVFKPPGDGMTAGEVAKYVGIAVLAVETVRLVLHLLGK